MIKGLKVVMIVWGVVGALFGLGFVFAPEQLCSILGYEKGPAYVPYLMALVGIACFVGSLFVIIAARDPLKHIMWVQLAIVWSLLNGIAGLYFIVKGNVNFSQAGMGPIMDVVFIVAFLIFYPWRKAPIT
jgi:energy-converting hydrogenase Eha subunit C